MEYTCICAIIPLVISKDKKYALEPQQLSMKKLEEAWLCGKTDIAEKSKIGGGNGEVKDLVSRARMASYGS
jgi:hypothetical protein